MAGSRTAPSALHSRSDGGRGVSSATESTLYFDSTANKSAGGTPVRPRRRNRGCKRTTRHVCRAIRCLGSGCVTLSTCGCCGCEEEFRSSAVVTSTLFTSILPILGLISAENTFAARNPTATMLDFPKYEYQDMVDLPPEMRSISKALVARMLVRVAIQMWLGLLLTAEQSTSKLVFSVLLDLLGCRFGRACCPVVARCASCSRDAGLVVAPAANTRCGRCQRDCVRSQRSCLARLTACCSTTCGVDCCLPDGDGDTVASDSESAPRAAHRRQSSRQSDSRLSNGSLRRPWGAPGASDDSTLTRTVANVSDPSPRGAGSTPAAALGASLNRFGPEPVPSVGSWPTVGSDSQSESSSMRLPRARHSEGSVGVGYGPDGTMLELSEPWAAGGLVFSVTRTVPDAPATAIDAMGPGRHGLMATRAASHGRLRQPQLQAEDSTAKGAPGASSHDVTQAQTLPSVASLRKATAHKSLEGQGAGPSQEWYHALLRRKGVKARQEDGNAPWSNSVPL